MTSRGVAGYFLLLLIAAALLLALQIFMPFMGPLAMAAAFAVVLHPLYTRILDQMNGHSDLAALSVLLIASACILVPIGIILVFMGVEAAKLYGSIADGSFALNTSALLKQVQHMLPQSFSGANVSDVIAGNLSAYIRDALVWISSHVTDAFSSIASLVLNLFIFFIALYFFLRDGESLKKTIIELSPLKDSDDRLIFDRLGIAVNSVIRGNLLIALLRGIFSAIGFFFFGVPNALLWGIVAGVAGLIPSVGILIVFAPAILYTYFFVGTLSAVALLLWGVLIVGLIDNALAPRFVGKGMQVHPLFVFLGIFGGISYFGPIGIFLGPLTLSLLFALLSIYSSHGRRSATE